MMDKSAGVNWLWDLAAALAFVCYAASAAFAPICLVAQQGELGFNLGEGGLIEAARNILIVVVLLFSGFLAAHIGKGTAIGYGLLMVGGALCCYAFAPSYVLVLLAAALVGLGGGVVEGLLNPLIHDLHPRDSGRFLNFINAFWSVGIVAMVLISGELLTRMVSWRTIAFGLGVFCVAVGALFVVLSLRRHERVDSFAEVFGHKLRILKLRGFWGFAAMMAICGGIEGGLTFWTATYVQRNLEGNARAAGIATACFAGGMVVARMAWGWLIPQRHLPRLIFCSAAAGALVSLSMPAISTIPTFYACLFVLGLTVACFWPSLQSYAAERLPVDSTSLFILLSCAGIPGFAVVCWIMGMLGDNFGLETGFMALPALFAALAAAIKLATPKIRI